MKDLVRPISPKVKARFETKFVKNLETGCWEWQMFLVKGYGEFCINYIIYQAHRISYEIHVGEIPDGLQVLHSCDNRSCVNPNHLFLGTQQDNVDDMIAKGRGDWSRPARGDKHGARTKPDRMARGANHGRYIKPERSARGSRHGMAILNETLVAEIRSRLKRKEGISRLAHKYGVSTSTIKLIKSRKTWVHVL